MYSGDGAVLESMNQRLGPIEFDRVRVSFGGQDTDIPLQAPLPVQGDGQPVEELVREAFRQARERATARLENAQRWVSVAHLDDNTCQACRDNDGHVYRNRKQAYADYPDGHGYVACVGGAGARLSSVAGKGIDHEPDLDPASGEEPGGRPR
jgi:hypothetical protein